MSIAAACEEVLRCRATQFDPAVVDAFARGEILQVLLFAVLFGFCLHQFGGRGTIVFDFIEKISHVFFSIVGVIMKLAPLGAFGGMAYTVAPKRGCPWPSTTCPAITPQRTSRMRSPPATPLMRSVAPM